MKYNLVWSVTLIFLTVLVSKSLSARSEFSNPRGKDRDEPDLIGLVSSFGYPIEIHKVTTEDDYILTVFRVPNKQSTYSPVFVQHGILANSATFLANKRGLVYYLYDYGYDVWVGNARGTSFSQSHNKFKTNSAAFWNFSFHEMGMCDLPAVLHHIMATSGKSKVHYVGHSMGTTMFLVFASLRPDLLKNVHSVTFMAPVAMPRHMSSLESPFVKHFLNLITTTLPKVGVPNFSKKKWLSTFFYKTCEEDTLVGRMCKRWMPPSQSYKDILDEALKARDLLDKAEESEDDEPSISDEDVEVMRVKTSASEFDKIHAEDSMWWFYDSTSFKNHQHFLQIADAGRFQQFDYGKEENKINYRGKEIPPRYPLRKIHKRIYLLSGGEDDLAQAQDIEWLAARLPDAWLIKQGFEDFDHSAFNLGMGINQVLLTVTKIIMAAELDLDPSVKRDEVDDEVRAAISEESPEVAAPPSPSMSKRSFSFSSIFSFGRNKPTETKGSVTK